MGLRDRKENMNNFISSAWIWAWNSGFVPFGILVFAWAAVSTAIVVAYMAAYRWAYHKITRLAYGYKGIMQLVCIILITWPVCLFSLLTRSNAADHLGLWLNEGRR